MEQSTSVVFPSRSLIVNQGVPLVINRGVPLVVNQDEARNSSLIAEAIIYYIKNLHILTMVERPIKKSERQQPQPSPDNDSQSTDSASPVESPRKVLKLDDVAPKRERKGKKSSSKEDSKQPQQINPALVRGPKPPKPQPKVEVQPEAESESEPETQSEPSPEE